MNNKILVVDDEESILEIISYKLKKEGFKVLKARSTEEASVILDKDFPDLIILDIMLPDVSGIEFMKYLRFTSNFKDIPVIFLTAKGEEIDKILGLELGADDYMTKPFSVQELASRVKAVLRRVKGEKKEKDDLIFGSLQVNFKKREVYLEKIEVKLTPKEFELLKELILADGKVLERNYLLSKIWGFNEPDMVETRTVDIHINHLRKKLKNEGKRIVSRPSIGYKFIL